MGILYCDKCDCAIHSCICKQENRMTIDKDKMREEFEKHSGQSFKCAALIKLTKEQEWFARGWKACAESYEKTLAESNDLWKDLRNVLECTQRNLSEANARNARLVESLELVHTCSCTICADCADAVRRGINANAESVAAWEAEKLEPLRREVEELKEMHAIELIGYKESLDEKDDEIIQLRYDICAANKGKEIV